MIDLHIHTSYSDGTDSVIEVLKECDKRKLELISFTDHESCKACLDLENINISEYYKGRVINGIELTTSFNGVNIDVLGYCFENPSIIQEKFEMYGTHYYWDEVSLLLRKKVLLYLDKSNYKYDSELVDSIDRNDKWELDLYNSLISNNLNISVIIGENFQEFLKKCINNKESGFYLDYLKYVPKLEEIVKCIRDNKGLIFLAHPLKYKNKCDLSKLIKKLSDEGLIDGMEVFHSDMMNADGIYLVDMANQNNLLMSGGSDYHGSKREALLGKVMYNSGEIDKSLISNWVYGYEKK